MAWGKKKWKSKKQFDGVRVTGFFKTKTKGLYVGKTLGNGDGLMELRKLCKQAADQEKELVFFLRYWPDDDDGDKPKFSLSASIDTPRPKGKDIEETEDDPDVDEEEAEEEEDEPEEKPKAKAKKADDGEDPNPF